MANPKACVGAEANGKLVGFLFGHIKGGEFGTSFFLTYLISGIISGCKKTFHGCRRAKLASFFLISGLKSFP